MVDDDRDFQTIVRGWLTPRYDLLSLSNGDGLIEDLAAVDPQLLLLDVRMPGPDGFKLCAGVRARPRFIGLPILFLTGCSEDEDFVKNLDAGGTAFLTKPVARKRLLWTIRELLAAAAPIAGAA